MNKFGIVLGVAAIATLAGCKDPDYQKGGATSQNDVKNVDTAVEKPVEVAPVTIEPVVQKCTCAPGTKHTSPCTCGAPDCKCVVEVKPVVTAVVSEPVEPEYTIYVVQSGDYLAKISKRFNVTISSIKRLNPSIKKDVIRVGQKLKIPGKVDVGVQPAPDKVVKSAKKASAASYTGATKEYVVKNGDTLGSIAYGNGINIRQLKELNGLSSDSLIYTINITNTPCRHRIQKRNDCRNSLKAVHDYLLISRCVMKKTNARYRQFFQQTVDKQRFIF